MAKPKPNPEAEKLAEKEKELAEAKKRIDELTDLLKHLQADYENYRKRKEKEMAEVREYANRELVSKLLPVLDHLEMALKHPKGLKQGVELIYAHLKQILENEGLEEIRECQRFDPMLHEAVGVDETANAPDGTITELLQKGYCYKKRVIRAAKARVAKSPSQKC